MSGVIAACLLSAGGVQAVEVSSEEHDFRVEVVTDTLRFPWALAFLPGGDMLVTERVGTLRRVTADGATHLVDGAPEVSVTGQGGLLDVALDPDFADNRRVYFCYADGGLRGHGTELAAATLVDDRLDGLEVLFVARPKGYGGLHFGCRIAFDEAGYLYLALGERGRRQHAQDLSTHHGGVMRLHRDGRVPADNPFVDRDGAQAEIYTYGNRNPQGLVRHPDSGALYELEHGPQGGDEINILRPGANYGWPLVSYGGEYGSGRQVGEGERMDGVEDALYYWDPSIAPSGMDFYLGDAFPRWRGNLFVGALKDRLLVRLVLDGAAVVHEERLLAGAIGRIREVATGPDGLLYLLTDADPGLLVRLVPTDDGSGS